VKYLLDTCIVSELRRPRPNANAWAWLSRGCPEDWYLSAVTVGELRGGARSAKETAQRLILERWIDEIVIPMFEGHILPLDVQVADRWGRLMGDGIAKGRKPSVTDSQIAATALTHGMTIVTRNVTDFRFDGLSVVNPFDEKETVQP